MESDKLELDSTRMRLGGSERRWLPWFGKTGKLAMRWACLVNRRAYSSVERTFEGIAATRKRLLLGWAQRYWDFLSCAAAETAGDVAGMSADWLTERRAHIPDSSELFLIDTSGRVLMSTHAPRAGVLDLAAKAVQTGLRGQFLHGPYVDPTTEKIGPSTSKFHDAVTLMFYQPILRDGQAVACLCARVPNDVMSDLIQREAGHVYRESGDNYVFMIESRFDPAIPPGAALSRSRFEDQAFTLGDNLKQGVRTAFGTIKVKRHTELELIFKNPATGELHPGVRETIRNGDNLFVAYPGYADYRHVPVIGKGVSLQLPGSMDRWGMMCEGDLEEVYRCRPLAYRVAVSMALIGAAGFAMQSALLTGLQLSPQAAWFSAGGIFLAAIAVIAGFVVLPMTQQLNRLSAFFLEVAERGASLKTRFKMDKMRNDESGELSQWANSFIDKIDETVDQVLTVAHRVSKAATAQSRSALALDTSSRAQCAAAVSAAGAVEQITTNIRDIAEHASAAERITNETADSSAHGRTVVNQATLEITRVSESVSHSSEILSQLGDRSKQISSIVDEIRSIADQTNLLALNAAIEAARAGEQGRGFAVVADEVRSLAARTASSTVQITSMIKGIQTEIQQAVTMMGTCTAQTEESVKQSRAVATALESINTGAGSSLAVAKNIAAATNEQRRASDEVAHNVEGIVMAAESNAQRIAEAKTSAVNLELLASGLQHSVSRFSA